ncbi:gamma-glutamylcyclotransferase [Halalkalibacter kiskunsagensis]
MSKTYHVFVYGTLRQHEVNCRLLKESKCHSRQCWTYGVLYNTGYGYPAMTQGMTSRVYGELYDITTEQLNRLDSLEGYAGKGQINHYDRITQTVYTDNSTVETFVYVFTSSQITNLEKIKFGDWKCHRYLNKDEILYFAYGSCMDSERFHRSGVKDQFALVAGCGIVKNYSLAYSRKSHDGGRADIIESNQWVEGKVYQIKNKTLDYLYKREGVYMNIYRPAFVDVIIDGVWYNDVLTFLVIDKEKETAPPEQYAAEILRGAKSFVSDRYYKKLKDDLSNQFSMKLNEEEI